jgi:hypothetical protein
MSRIAAIVAAALSAASCAGPAMKPALTPAAPRHDALLILPGLGYGRGDGHAFRVVADSARADGIDVFVPPYLTRGGLADTRGKLRDYIRAQHLERYERLHVFAFIAGAWAFNPLAEREAIPNLSTVIYDRSPLQERAPAIAADAVPVLAWLRFGSTIFDLAKTPYPPLREPAVKVALLVETQPTTFIRQHDKALAAGGPVSFDCDGLGQRYDACTLVAMSHDDIYTRFAEVWPAVRSFIETGRFDR